MNGYCEEISIELLYKREDLLKEIAGKRIFLTDEFSGKAHRMISNNRIITQNHIIIDAEKRNIIKVLDKEVYDENDIDVALSKNEFANMVLNRQAPYDEMDVSGFTEIFRQIKNIIDTSNNL